MKFLDSLKVRYKLLGILGVIIFGFFLIALFYKVERDTETEMQRLEQQADQTNTLLYQIQVEVLQARHHEKDFLLRGQDNSLDQHRQTLAAFQTDIQRLQRCV